jgi:hypothetical protein
MAPLRYHPFYCEENIWHLCQSTRVIGLRRRVVFVSNPSRTVLFFGQRAGETDGVVIWDYHVFLLAHAQRWQVWDPDGIAGCPVTTDEYLARAFPYLYRPAGHDGGGEVAGSALSPQAGVNPALVPDFRVTDADDYVAHFGSDRRHMRDAHGAWNRPPPPWSCLGQGHNLHRFVDVTGDFHGEVLDFPAFVERYASH